MSATTAITTPSVRPARRFRWLGMVPFVMVHIAALAVFWFPITWPLVGLALALYVVRMFAVTGFYHRYFSHRTFKTSRLMQFFMALLAQSSSQQGVLWWGAHHRKHHKFSDMPQDTHSPVQDGFWYSHFLWVWERDNGPTDLDAIKDFAKYPELRFLDRYWVLPPLALGVLLFAFGGIEAVLWGFFVSTTLLWHGTFTINSLSHLFGKRRFDTTDDSRNNWLLAIITLGEGWHNNHHHHMHSTRQGFYWWEIDITYYILKVMSWVGLVWDLREPPERIYAEP